MDSNPERRYLFPTDDAYVFSFDVGGGRLSQSGRGWNLLYRNWAPGPRNDYDVFPLRGESVVYDHDAIWGHVLSLRGKCDFQSYGDTAAANGDLLIRTRDNVLIEAAYYGANRLQELGQRKLLLAGKKLDPAIDIRVCYWLQFDTSHPKYKWLSQTPCVGFGRAQIMGTEPNPDDGFEFPVQIDVYALS